MGRDRDSRPHDQSSCSSPAMPSRPRTPCRRRCPSRCRFFQWRVNTIPCCPAVYNAICVPSLVPYLKQESSQVPCLMAVSCFSMAGTLDGAFFAAEAPTGLASTRSTKHDQVPDDAGTRDPTGIHASGLSRRSFAADFWGIFHQEEAPPLDTNQTDQYKGRLKSLEYPHHLQWFTFPVRIRHCNWYINNLFDIVGIDYQATVVLSAITLLTGFQAHEVQRLAACARCACFSEFA
jgi:hypothetical protein